MTHQSWYAARRRAKEARVMRVLAFFERWFSGTREYRIRFEGGVYYAEYRDRIRWRQLPSLRTWAGNFYTCASQKVAEELVLEDRERIRRNADVPRFQAV